MLILLRHSVEYLAGQRDEAPFWLAHVPSWLTGSLVWLLAIGLIYAFCGQTTKFLYIDF
jgi:hypothetical protein